MVRAAKSLRCLTLTVAALATAAALPSIAGAAQKPVTRGSRYLALGDSYTFGYQEAQEVPPPNYFDPASFRGYPELLGAQLHLKVANASCPGETSASLINKNGPSNACENNPAPPFAHYRPTFPLHVTYNGSQLAYAVSYLRHHHNVRLVSLMIGGDDLYRCQKTTSDGCLSSSEQQATYATLQANLHLILSRIRHKAHYRGQLVIVNYPSPYANALLNTITQQLNAKVDAAAKPFRVRIADGYGVFQTAEAHSGGDPCRAGLLVQEGSPSKCGIHPSYAGQSLLAQAVLKVIKL